MGYVTTRRLTTRPQADPPCQEHSTCHPSGGGGSPKRHRVGWGNSRAGCRPNPAFGARLRTRHG